MIEDNSGHGPAHVAPADKPASYKLFWASVMLVSGTFTTLFAKVLWMCSTVAYIQSDGIVDLPQIQFETTSEGIDSCNVGDDDNKVYL